jgi:HSP20 family protein
MLVRTDPFRELDRVASQVFGTPARPAVMPMDAWRDGETFVIEFDLPAVDPDSVDLNVERNVLTVRAERLSPTGPDVELLASERPRGVFSRQVILSDALDTDRRQAIDA